jgi:hypothetical protein
MRLNAKQNEPKDEEAIPTTILEMEELMEKQRCVAAAVIMEDMVRSSEPSCWSLSE